jgi:hypothetical protein
MCFFLHDRGAQLLPPPSKLQADLRPARSLNRRLWYDLFPGIPSLHTGTLRTKVTTARRPISTTGSGSKSSLKSANTRSESARGEPGGSKRCWRKSARRKARCVSSRRWARRSRLSGRWACIGRVEHWTVSVCPCGVLANVHCYTRDTGSGEAKTEEGLTGMSHLTTCTAFPAAVRSILQFFQTVREVSLSLNSALPILVHLIHPSLDAVTCQQNQVQSSV